MRIILIGGQSIPGIGGVESYMLNLAQSLKAQGNNVELICSDRNAYVSEYNGVKIIHKVCPRSNIIALPLLFFKSLGYIFQNYKSIDIVNFQSIFLAFIPGLIVRLLGCKVCYTIHSLAEDNPKHGKLIRLAMKLVAFVSIYGCGKNIITVSNSKADEVRARYGKTCHVIPCGVNYPMHDPKSSILDKYNITPYRYYLTIGRIDPIKNLDILIKAYNCRNNHAYKLVIAGDYQNDYGSYLLALAQNNQNIIFVGRVMGEDKEHLLKYSYVNCLVSSSEGMPLSLLEAMSYGKPCIVSDIPAIRELIDDEWGYWCQVKDVDSTAEQMRNVESIDNISDVGKKMADYVLEHHTWDNIAAKYKSYIQTL